MKLLIIEDDRRKADDIVAVAKSIGSDIQIRVSQSLAEAVRTMEHTSFDLIVLDFMLPLVEAGDAIESGQELLRIVNASSKNRSAGLVAVTAYPDLVEALSQKFSEAGVVVCEYSEHSYAWRTTLTSLIRKYAIRSSRRFAIICALDKERSAFRKTRAALGSSKSLMGLDVCDVTIDGTLGAAVLCPRMGLVNASIITALVIERFSPEVLCMSGICAGVSSKSRIGQILIAHPCFEYQVGKYSPTGFQMEQYQATLKEELRQCLKLLGDSEDVVDTVYEGLEDGAFVASKAVVSTFVSGSALIADKTKLEEILTQHRKMGGLDMEAFGVMQAASLGSSTVKAFSAKAVVDYADEKKGNQYHEAGCTASARFCVEAISKLLYASQ